MKSYGNLYMFDGFVLLQAVTSVLGICALIMILNESPVTRIWGCVSGGVSSIGWIAFLFAVEGYFLLIPSFAYTVVYVVGAVNAYRGLVNETKISKS